MSSKRNQAIAIARFLMYKYGLNQQLEGMTDEEYLAHPMGLCDRSRYAGLTRLSYRIRTAQYKVFRPPSKS